MVVFELYNIIIVIVVDNCDERWLGIAEEIKSSSGQVFLTSKKIIFVILRKDIKFSYHCCQYGKFNDNVIVMSCDL